MLPRRLHIISVIGYSNALTTQRLNNTRDGKDMRMSYNSDYVESD